jgi:hypothetical protein
MPQAQAARRHRAFQQDGDLAPAGPNTLCGGSDPPYSCGDVPGGIAVRFHGPAAGRGTPGRRSTNPSPRNHAGSDLSIHWVSMPSRQRAQERSHSNAAGQPSSEIQCQSFARSLGSCSAVPTPGSPTYLSLPYDAVGRRRRPRADACRCRVSKHF